MPAGWHAELRLDYAHEHGRTRSHFEHRGPLRVLKALYPEGDAICHHVLVHPPAGLVSGDRLAVDVHVGAGAHAVVTTPGASRWYCAREDAPVPEAEQRVQLTLAPGARLEWLPLEALVYDGAQALNRMAVRLAPGASMIGWDLLALGLPASDAPFTRGWLDQRLAIEGLWLEQGRLAADDPLLLDSPLGLAGHRALATVWLAWGDDPPAAVAEAALAAGQAVLADHPAVWAGITRAQPRLLVMRALAPRVEPLFALARDLRAAWRQAAWGLPGVQPRTWQL